MVDNARTRVKAKLKRLVDTSGSLLSPQIPMQVRRRTDLYMKLPVCGEELFSLEQEAAGV